MRLCAAYITALVRNTYDRGAVISETRKLPAIVYRLPAQAYAQPVPAYVSVPHRLHRAVQRSARRLFEQSYELVLLKFLVHDAKLRPADKRCRRLPDTKSYFLCAVKAPAAQCLSKRRWQQRAGLSECIHPLTSLGQTMLKARHILRRNGKRRAVNICLLHGVY